ncbi:MAG: penicillin-binding protein 2 [Terriglobia bacterium]
MQTRFPDDEHFPAWRIAFFQYAIAATFLVLLLGYWRLQIFHHRTYLEAAERNRIRNLPVIAPRGRILDREGRILADNFPAFSVLLIRDSPANFTPERLAGVAHGLGLDPEDLQRTIERTAKLPRFQPVVLKQSATMQDIAFVESHRVEYPELDLLQVQQRSYPRQTIAAAMLGYVGEVSEEMIAQPRSPYRPGDVVGKFGLERSYNSVLSGRDGMRRVVVNSRGQEMGSETTINALPGNDLRLTIDLDIQMAAEAALGNRPGAVVALDPRSGEVLAMVSQPAFDPNDFARRIDRETWQRLNTDPQKPLMNKAIQAHLAPGSVFKIITSAAALETGTIKPDYTLQCAGLINIYGHTYHDWVFDKGRGHGSVDLHRAIVHSCDVYFYTLGKLLGIEKLSFFAKQLGLGARTGIDLPSEDPGLVPSPEWARKTFKRQWWAGETISVAIGQGAVATTPLQLAYAIGGIASGGIFHRPHLAFKGQLLALGLKPDDESEHQFPLSEGTVDAVCKGMWGVVNEGGTGAAAREPGLDIAGKTGTAQVVSTGLQQAARKHEFKSNAWFVGYSPTDRPEIVVSALVMQGEHSTLAVPIVRDVIRTYLEKKEAHRPPRNQLQTQVRVLSEARTPEAFSAGKSANQ